VHRVGRGCVRRIAEGNFYLFMSSLNPQIGHSSQININISVYFNVAVVLFSIIRLG